MLIDKVPRFNFTATFIRIGAILALHYGGLEFEPWSGIVEFLVGKATLGQVFSEYFGFPC
jgi:hypothetical protein